MSNKIRGSISLARSFSHHWLTCAQSLAANLSGVKLHMDGLETLVNSRGGISSLPDSNPRRLATWVDSEGESTFLAALFSCFT